MQTMKSSSTLLVLAVIWFGTSVRFSEGQMRCQSADYVLRDGVCYYMLPDEVWQFHHRIECSNRGSKAMYIRDKEHEAWVTKKFLPYGRMWINLQSSTEYKCDYDGCFEPCPNHACDILQFRSDTLGYWKTPYTSFRAKSMNTIIYRFGVLRSDGYMINYHEQYDKYPAVCESPAYCVVNKWGSDCQKRCMCKVPGCKMDSGICNNIGAGCQDWWAFKTCSQLIPNPDLSTKELAVFYLAISATITFPQFAAPSELVNNYFYKVFYEEINGTLSGVITVNHDESVTNLVVEIEGLNATTSYNVYVMPYRRDVTNNLEAAGKPTPTVNFTTDCFQNEYGDTCKLQCGECKSGNCERLTGICKPEVCTSWYAPPGCRTVIERPDMADTVLEVDYLGASAKVMFEQLRMANNLANHYHYVVECTNVDTNVTEQVTVEHNSSINVAIAKFDGLSYHSTYQVQMTPYRQYTENNLLENGSMPLPVSFTTDCEPGMYGDTCADECGACTSGMCAWADGICKPPICDGWIAPPMCIETIEYPNMSHVAVTVTKSFGTSVTIKFDQLTLNSTIASHYYYLFEYTYERKVDDASGMTDTMLIAHDAYGHNQDMQLVTREEPKVTIKAKDYIGGNLTNTTSETNETSTPQYENHTHAIPIQHVTNKFVLIVTLDGVKPNTRFTLNVTPYRVYKDNDLEEAGVPAMGTEFRSGCISGWHGIECEIECGHCTSGVCEQYTGHCIPPGCETWWISQTCKVLIDEPNATQSNLAFRSRQTSAVEIEFEQIRVNDSMSQYYYYGVEYKEPGNTFSQVNTIMHDFAKSSVDTTIVGLDPGKTYVVRVTPFRRDLAHELEESGLPTMEMDVKTACDVGTFGYVCAKECHCKTGPCHLDTGVCDTAGCENWWIPETTCTETIGTPTMREDNVTVLSVTLTQINVTFEPMVIASNMTIFYEYAVEYKKHKADFFNQTEYMPHDINLKEINVTLDDLEPGTNYTIQVTPYRVHPANTMRERGLPTAQIFAITENYDNPGLTPAAQAGIAVGSIFGIVLLGLIAAGVGYVLYKRYKAEDRVKPSNKEEPQDDSNEVEEIPKETEGLTAGAPGVE